MQQKPADIKVQQCSSCCEHGFDIRIRSKTNEWQRWHADYHRLWSNAKDFNLGREVGFKTRELVKKPDENSCSCDQKEALAYRYQLTYE